MKQLKAGTYCCVSRLSFYLYSIMKQFWPHENNIIATMKCDKLQLMVFQSFDSKLKVQFILTVSTTHGFVYIISQNVVLLIYLIVVHLIQKTMIATTRWFLTLFHPQLIAQCSTI